ncbi:lipid A biosynthesis lauroyl acyltransferase [Silvimonas soli]|uniref:LpxL/LpxP family acyltransferase n=1 Tax=Silvimonas soli TaxID=2980100 RepID=UPI0024B32162|nr:lipid A biosynthesis lauroyl acyltransferase [Silvimonas soli]
MSFPARLLAAFFWLLHLLPFTVLRWLGAALGSLLYLVAGRRRRIGMTNLRLCFPEWTDAQRSKVIREHFRLLSTCLLSYGVLWFGSKKRVEKLVRREGYEHYLAVQDQSIILLAPHFIGLDYGGIRHTIDHWGASMYSASHQNPMDELLLMGRSRFGKPLLIKRNDGIRAIVKALRQHTLPFYYLPDQDMGPKESIFAPFFGIPAATIPALSRLSQLGRAVVVPMITRLEKDGFVTRYYPAWTDNFPSDDLLADTARMNRFIEDRVREIPAQYYWLHRRFKTRPEGDKSPY